MPVHTGPEIVIRPLTERDLVRRMGEINQLDRVLSMAGGYITRDYLTQMLRSGFTTFFGAFVPDGDLLVGDVAAVKVPQPHVPKWLLEDLAVLPTFQHSGIGRLLVTAVILQAKAGGASKLDLTTKYERGIVTWYERFGFQRRDVKPGVEIPAELLGESAYMRADPTRFDASALDTSMITLADAA